MCSIESLSDCHVIFFIAQGKTTQRKASKLNNEFTMLLLPCLQICCRSDTAEAKSQSQQDNCVSISRAGWQKAGPFLPALWLRLEFPSSVCCWKLILYDLETWSTELFELLRGCDKLSHIWRINCGFVALRHRILQGHISRHSVCSSLPSQNHIEFQESLVLTHHDSSGSLHSPTLFHAPTAKAVQ